MSFNLTGTPPTSTSTSTPPSSSSIIHRSDDTRQRYQRTQPSSSQSQTHPTPRTVAAKLPPLKELPDKLDSWLPESCLYSQLLSLEHRVDATLTARRISMYEAIAASHSIHMMMRLYLWHEWRGNEQDPLDPPSWTLRIASRFYESDGITPITHASITLTQLLTSFTCHIHHPEYATTTQMDLITWEKAHATVNTQGFEIHRLGSGTIPLTLTFHLTHSPPRFTVSSGLRSLLGIHTETKLTIYQALWVYIRSHHLQSTSDPSQLNLDPSLSQLFGLSTCSISQLPTLLRSHMFTPDPIVIAYTVRTSGPSPSPADVYDISLTLPESVTPQQLHAASAPLPSDDIQKQNDKINEILQDIHRCYTRREFMMTFVDAPIETMQGLIAYQANNLKSLSDTSFIDEENERRSRYYEQPWVPDAVDRFLSQPSQIKPRPKPFYMQAQPTLVKLPMEGETNEHVSQSINTSPSPSPTPDDDDDTTRRSKRQRTSRVKEE